jgi:hypothetical protein
MPRSFPGKRISHGVHFATFVNIYQVYEAKTVGEFAGKAANAATQTEDKGGEDREEAEEYCKGSTVTW